MVCPSILASIPASMLNQNSPDLGIPNRVDLKASRLSRLTLFSAARAPEVSAQPAPGFTTFWRRVRGARRLTSAGAPRVMGVNKTKKKSETQFFRGGFDAGA
jgi:hypothetical protein